MSTIQETQTQGSERKEATGDHVFHICWFVFEKKWSLGPGLFHSAYLGVFRMGPTPSEPSKLGAWSLFVLRGQPHLKRGFY